MKRFNFVPSCSRSALFLLLASLPLVAADEQRPVPPSAYAAAPDIAEQIEVYVKQIEKDITSQEEYGEEQQSRVAKDANTLIVLGQLLGNHDKELPLKGAAPAIVKAASSLADSAGEFASAKAALAELKKALDSRAGGEVDWEPAADLSQLMKQVPIVNNRLRSGVTGRRFERTIDQSVGHATTLAAIAQASQFDTAYCSTEEDEAKWAKICIDMRDAAAEVRDAVRKKDQSAAKVGLEKLVKTCDDCHHAFRD